jgi:glutathione synthase/RimK-type ligase-like ATP-grasp enzyme
MATNIIILRDYRKVFGSKYNSVPYRSGLDLELLMNHLVTFGIMAELQDYSDLELNNINKRDIYWHDSIEDIGYHYKTYMEDMILAIELAGAKVIPGFKYIRAHNNKVFMESLRKLSKNPDLNNLFSRQYGCFEEIDNQLKIANFPVVVKGSEEAQSRNVYLGKTNNDTRKIIKNITYCMPFIKKVKEYLRVQKYPGYTKESNFRKKFILQQFIPELKNDWKLLIFGDICYILRRGIKEGDFRASGSHHNYGFGSHSSPPDGIFDFAYAIYEFFNVPYISLDVAYDGANFYIIEFQFVSFGTSTHLYSDCYFTKGENGWFAVDNQFDIEYLYARSLYQYLLKGNLIEK